MKSVSITNPMSKLKDCRVWPDICHKTMWVFVEKRSVIKAHSQSDSFAYILVVYESLHAYATK